MFASVAKEKMMMSFATIQAESVGNIQTREKIECKPTIKLYKKGKMVEEMRRPNAQEIRDLV